MITQNISLLADFGLECITSAGKRVNVVEHLLEGMPSVAPPGSTARRGAPGPSGPKLDSGSTAGLVIGLLAALAIIGALAYFVGYKRFYRERKARSFARMDIETHGAARARAACL